MTFIIRREPQSSSSLRPIGIKMSSNKIKHIIHIGHLNLLLLFLIPCTGGGQVLLNPAGEVLEDLPFFNAAYIQKFKVRSFSGNYATKFDRDIIRPNTDSYAYEFDRLGQLVRKYKIRLSDTLISTYEYDYKGNVVVHREANKYGFHENRYKYDNRNRVTSMELRRDNKSAHNKLSFDLDESYIVSTETYEYIQLEGIDYKKICYNGGGRIYRTEFYYFNEKALLSKKESALQNGSGRSEVSYFYDANGRLEELKIVSKASSTHTNKKVFTYDEKGNVLSRHIYRNGELMLEDQLVYFEETGLLKAVITREQANGMLTILQFKNYRNY